MVKLVGIVCVVASLLFASQSRNKWFSRYKPVEAYEVRPGILMMPRHSANGEICSVVLQRIHFANGVVELDSTLPRETVNQIFDELAPPNERGPLSTSNEMARLSLYAGNAVTSRLDYQNVSLEISRQASSRGDVVAVIDWKGRTCQ